MTHNEIEVSFVMPCLNEADSVAACIEAARACIDVNHLAAEIVIADNGSTDGSQSIALEHGARVVDVPGRGYGSALMGGFDAARGRFLVMADADQSYDFGEAMAMIEAMRNGADLVMGSRFRGHIEPGAMPFLHRWVGNPVLSFLGRVLFKSPISDFHCGLRGITKGAYQKLGLRTVGMEFATEMVAKASAWGLCVKEVPVTLRPDARSRPPHLRTWRDGWRHLRFMLILSPRWTIFVPGLVIFVLGASLMVWLGIGPLTLGSVTLDIHSMLVAGMLVIVGYQAMTTAIAVRIYVLEEEIGPPAPWMGKAVRYLTLERGLIAGVLLTLAGAAFIGFPGLSWARSGFGALDVSVTLRSVAVGVVLVAIGIQTLLMSFVYSMLGIKRRASA